MPTTFGEQFFNYFNKFFPLVVVASRGRDRPPHNQEQNIISKVAPIVAALVIVARRGCRLQNVK